MSGKAPCAPVDRQAFGLRIPRAADAGLRALRAVHQPSHQGWRLWSATWLLLSYLQGRSLQDTKVIDVGCGWGLAGIYCASRGATVICCDLDPEVLHIARYHADFNDTVIRTESRGFDAVDDRLLSGADWVIGADICFRGDLIDPLFKLLQRARHAGAAVALADPGRAPMQALATRCVRDLGAWAGPVSTPEPLVAWPGERPLVHGRLITMGAPAAAG